MISPRCLCRQVNAKCHPEHERTPERDETGDVRDVINSPLPYNTRKSQGSDCFSLYHGTNKIVKFSATHENVPNVILSRPQGRTRCPRQHTQGNVLHLPLLQRPSFMKEVEVEELKSTNSHHVSYDYEMYRFVRFTQVLGV